MHHQGDGHRQRALAIAQHAPEYFTLIGTNLENRTGDIKFLELPCDNLENVTTNTHLKATHYTPLREPIITQRMYKIANWVAENKPILMVVDVSVEIAMLSRLFSIPTIYVRLAGNRLDSAHIDAFLAAEALLCPFSSQLENEQTPLWIKEKSHYFANLTRTSCLPTISKANNIVVLLGAGGHELTIDHLINLAQQMPDWEIDVLAPLEDSHKNIPDNLKLRGWVNDCDKYLQQASLVIGSAGDGVVANMLNLKKPYICAPQKRAFAEQVEKAKKLQALGIEVIFDINKVVWPDLISIALEKGAVISKIDDGKFAKEATTLIQNIATRGL